MKKTKVYFTRDISNEGLIKIFTKMERELKEKVAVKISSGEPGGNNYLKPELIKGLVNKLNGTIVECSTAYKGKRYDPKDHWEVFKSHGFLSIAPCDILDEHEEIELHIKDSKHLKGINIVGKNLEKYDSMLVLSHFKGHQMGGFGGALKNISIGIASRNGKAWIHSWGNTRNTEEMWKYTKNQDAFLESMAEASLTIVNYFKPNNIAYMNIANNLSIDCDCNSNPASPEMEDIGIFASVDPVAIDQCCYDSIINSNDPGKEKLIERMTSRNAIHLIETAEKLGLGNKNYELVNID